MCAFEIFVGHPVCQWVSKTLEVWSHRKSFLTVLDACSGSQKPVRISLISMISGWCIVSFWVRCRCLLVVSVPANVASRPIQFDEKRTMRRWDHHQTTWAVWMSLPDTLGWGWLPLSKGVKRGSSLLLALPFQTKVRLSLRELPLRNFLQNTSFKKLLSEDSKNFYKKIFTRKVSSGNFFKKTTVIRNRIVGTIVVSTLQQRHNSLAMEAFVWKFTL